MTSKESRGVGSLHRMGKNKNKIKSGCTDQQTAQDEEETNKDEANGTEEEAAGQTSKARCRPETDIEP